MGAAGTGGPALRRVAEHGTRDMPDKAGALQEDGLARSLEVVTFRDEADLPGLLSGERDGKQSSEG